MGYRVCADHRKTGVNDVLQEREVLLPRIDDFIALLSSGWIMRKRDARTCFAHHHIPAGIAEIWGTVRVAGGGFYRRREMDFGTSIGPAVCMAVASELRRLLRARGVSGEVFMDDWLLTARDEQNLELYSSTMNEMAEMINYNFDERKEETGDTIVLLGLLLSSIGDGWISLPEAKVAGRLNHATECVGDGKSREHMVQIENWMRAR